MIGISARRLLSATLSIAALAVIVFFSPSARAVGTVTISPKEVEEVDGKWKLNMSMNYGSIPHLAHIPMIFEFTQTVHWERALTDKSPDKPILVRTPLQNQQPTNESMDVGFSDPMGKIFQTTKFDFVVRRDRGYEAGEYSLKIKRESDGVVMGQVQKITLKGDNPIVDRRAIVFSGEKSSKKGPEGGSADKGSSGGASDADKDKKPAGNDAAANAGSGEKSDAPGGEPGTPNEPPAVAPKQGGCGCRLGDDGTPAAPPIGAGALAVLGIALVARRRRNRPAVR